MVFQRRSRGTRGRPSGSKRLSRKLVHVPDESGSSTESDSSEFEFAVPRNTAPMTRSRSGLLNSQLTKPGLIPDSSLIQSNIIESTSNNQDNKLDIVDKRNVKIKNDNNAVASQTTVGSNTLQVETSSFVDNDNVCQAALSNEDNSLSTSKNTNNSSSSTVNDDNDEHNDNDSLSTQRKTNNASSSTVNDDNILTKSTLSDISNLLLQPTSSSRMDEDFDIAKFTGISTEASPSITSNNTTDATEQEDAGFIRMDISDEQFLDQFPEIDFKGTAKSKRESRRRKLKAQARTIAEYATPTTNENLPDVKEDKVNKKEDKVKPGIPIKRHLDDLISNEIKNNVLKKFKSENDNNENILKESTNAIRSGSPQFNTEDSENDCLGDKSFGEADTEYEDDDDEVNRNILDFDMPFPNLGEDINFDVNQIPRRPDANYNINSLGEKGLETYMRERALTTECIKQLYNSLMNIPKDAVERDPQGLMVHLMPHQRQALSWMKWREQQDPVSGGILADDMGLGKTLQLISLILAIKNEKKQKEGTVDVESEDDLEADWSLDYEDTRKTYEGRTLVICPPSLTRQWEREVKTKVQRGKLRVYVYHGNTRQISEKRLAKFDIVITTYNLIKQEYENFVLPRKNKDSRLFKIKWERVILDEAHFIRNFRCKGSEAVCELEAKNRWALTGTPIQNKEDDFYALLKFLKCAPFDEFPVWRRWICKTNAAGNQRLIVISKSLMLRRTKAELMAKGLIQNLPDKNFDIIEVKLDRDEKIVYQKLLLYSQSFFHEFLRQKMEKEHLKEFGCHARPNVILQEVPDKLSKLLKVLMKHHTQVEAHYILVLILRLRQMCCHPSLIKSMLDKEDIDFEGEGLPIQKMNSDMLQKLDDLMTDEEDSDYEEFNINESMAKRVMSRTNPVFKPEKLSSKVRAVIETIDSILDRGEKVVVVSQWTSFLQVIARHINGMPDAKYEMFTGKVSIKDRQHIVDRLNDNDDSLNILLLSLTAGGVGLNLVGANNLLLIDLHWNPQWETQAQDRIYRFGQQNNVHVYKEMKGWLVQSTCKLTPELKARMANVCSKVTLCIPVLRMLYFTVFGPKTIFAFVSRKRKWYFRPGFICKDTIEEKIKALQDEKLKIAKRVLTGTVSNRLTIEDLKLLFS